MSSQPPKKSYQGRGRQQPADQTSPPQLPTQAPTGQQPTQASTSQQPTQASTSQKQPSRQPSAAPAGQQPPPQQLQGLAQAVQQVNIEDHGVGRGRGRGRARSIQSVSTVSAPVTHTTPSSDTSTTSSPTGSGGRAAVVADIPEADETATVATHSSDKSELSRSSLEDKPPLIEMTHRPDEGGRNGKTIFLKANHFKLELEREDSLIAYHYSVKLEHDRLGDKLNREESFKCFWRVVGHYQNIFQHPFSLVYDGDKQLFICKQFKIPSELKVEIVLGRDSRPCNVTMRVGYLGTIQLDMQRLAQTIGEGRVKPTLLFDHIYRSAHFCPLSDTGMAPGGRGFFTPPGPNDRDVELGSGRQIWTGYTSAAKAVRGWKANMVLNMSYTAFYKQMPLVEFMAEILQDLTQGGGGPQRGGGRRPPGFWSDPRRVPQNASLDILERKTFEREIKTLRINVMHRGEEGKQMEYRVHGVMPIGGTPNDVRFRSRQPDGTELDMTVAEYFRREYKTSLNYPNLPCINVGTQKRPIYFPAEVCWLAKNQKCQKKLSERMTADMIKKACKPAPDRELQIEQMIQQVARLDQDPFAATFGIKISNRMTEIPTARMLLPPKLGYGGNQTVQPRDGQWRMENCVFARPVNRPIIHWGLLSFLRRSDQPALENFSKVLSSTANHLRLMLDEYPTAVRYGERDSDVAPMIGQIMDEVHRQTGDVCLLLVVCISAKGSPLYNTVKRVAECELGITTQVVTARVVMRTNPQIALNLSLKINAKLGGINWAVIEESRLWMRVLEDQESPTLLLGIDVSRPSAAAVKAGDSKTPSIAAVVGSTELNGYRFSASVHVKKHATEDVQFIQDAIRERLLHFYQLTKRKPTRIIVYREGLDEGSFHKTMDEEVRAIRNAWMSLQLDQGASMIRVTYISCQKRHLTRLFCRHRAEASGKSFNVPPGTCVDSTITHPETFDFFLVPHFGIQGTSRPVHVAILLDENQFTSDDIQNLTYCLCYIYVRCTRSVSIPAPAYYAKLAMLRAKAHLSKHLGDDAETRSLTSGESDAASHVSTDSATLQRCCTLVNALTNSMYFV